MLKLTIWDFMNSNFGSNVMGAIVSTAIVALGGAIFYNHYWKQIKFAKQMEKYKISSISLSATNKRQLKNVFRTASTIKIIYVAGHNFILNNEFFAIAKSRKNPPTIKYLLSQKNSDFLKNIATMEMNEGNRGRETNINDDIDKAVSALDSLKMETLEYRQFNTEYRMPVIIAEYDDGDIIKRQVWLSVTLPPYKSRRNITLFGEDKLRSSDSTLINKDLLDDDDELNVVEMAETHFNSAWNNSK